MTAAQKAARANFKKAVAEAKKLRNKNPKLTQAQAVKQAWAMLKSKKIGDFSRSGTKVKDTKGPAKFKKPDYSVKRNAEGVFKKWSKVNGVPKKAAKKTAKKNNRHTDTKSHNVNIRVMSGIENYFTRVTNDVNGNPRYVIHFLYLLNDEERRFIPFSKRYNYAVKKANKIGGKKYHNQSYGGGIVFQSYNLERTWDAIQKIKENPGPIK